MGIMVNSNWDLEVTVLKQHCSWDLELLYVKVHPFCLPREFSSVVITVVYPSTSK